MASNLFTIHFVVSLTKINKGLFLFNVCCVKRQNLKRTKIDSPRSRTMEFDYNNENEADANMSRCV